ncbi:MAG: mitochondrial small ribosomal subunit protein uS17m, partial [Desulfuromonadales bacterium]|nr:mitochondrial small ribosomal subunit protein uS17m [Desulfuromonadales bacterium]NIS42364.1 mitochondrial small ribosomal subunit protein uS17m [Desulfuromonadales bacterium]
DSTFKVGDRVTIQEGAPVSKKKRWVALPRE